MAANADVPWYLRHFAGDGQEKGNNLQQDRQGALRLTRHAMLYVDLLQRNLRGKVSLPEFGGSLQCELSHSSPSLNMRLGSADVIAPDCYHAMTCLTAIPNSLTFVHTTGTSFD